VSNQQEWRAQPASAYWHRLLLLPTFLPRLASSRWGMRPLSRPCSGMLWFVGNPIDSIVSPSWVVGQYHYFGS
jgi:hypothetical protein